MPTPTRIASRQSLLVALAMIGAGYWWWRAERAASAPAALNWAVVERRTMAATVVTTGAIRLKTGAQVRVGSQQSGVVLRLNVAVGSRVKKGDLIAELDTRAIEARATRSRAQLQLDGVALERARSHLARGERLLAERLIPEQQAQDLRWEAEQMRMRVERSAADVAAAAVDLEHAQIRAPISGTIASVSTQEGETVASSLAPPTFVTIINEDALELVAMVDETDIADVRPGQTTVFTTEAVPAREVCAVVRRVNPAATILSGVVNYEVVASIVALPDFLKPDMTANVTIVTAQHETLAVPDAAVHRRGDGSVVYCEEAAGPRARTVTTGARYAGFTEIKRGLDASTRVLLGSPPPEAAEPGQ